MSSINVHHLASRSQAVGGRKWQNSPSLWCHQLNKNILLLIHCVNLQELLVVLIWTKNKIKSKRKIRRSEDTPMALSLSAISSWRESWKPHDLLILCFSLLWCSLVWHLELHLWHCDWFFLYSTTLRDPGCVARRETLQVMGEAKGIVLIWPRG